MKIFKFLFSPVFMGVLFVIFAASMAVATFVENDYGSAAAYNFIYDTRWFELILLLLAVNLIGRIITFRLYRRSKLTVFIFHAAFVVMLAGAAITRYTGWEGTIHIREGEEQQTCFSGEKYLGYVLKGNAGNILSRNSTKYYLGTSSAANYKKSLTIDGKKYELILARVLPNATEMISESPSGQPVISFMVSGGSGMQTVSLRKGDTKLISGVSVGLDPLDDPDLTITSDTGSFRMKSRFPIEVTRMMGRETITIGPGSDAELKPMEILSVNGLRIVPQEMALKGVLRTVSLPREQQETGKNAFIFHLFSGNETAATIYLWDDQSGKTAAGSADINGNQLEISYGPRDVSLPFSLRLNDFVLERYPGSSSPSGYKSDVVLIDKPAGVEKPFTIYMNNILKYKGYRFYQSSYDQDEKGTILSVNHDRTGMSVTYTGYGILFLFIILTLLNRKSAFNNANPGYWISGLRKRVPLILALVLLSGSGGLKAQKLIPDRVSADEFGKVLVQDQKGRTKPLFALSDEVLRKVARENKFEGLTSMQVWLGIYLDFDHWKDVPLIAVSGKDLRNTIGIRGNRAAFSDLVDMENGGTYKLSGDVSKAYSKSPGERSKLDKEIMKVDERLNIVYMIYTGGFLKIFPLSGDSFEWATPDEAIKKATGPQDSLYLKSVIPMLAEALQTNNNASAANISASVREYQKKFSRYGLPPESKMKAELLYNRMMIFEKLFPFYATIGLIMLVVLIGMVIRGEMKPSPVIRILGWLLFAGFLFHTFGLAIRWYVSGHSPMSNGYESMIFISWVTLMAGFIFSRRSKFALSATAVLASMTLMVAHLSFMDPVITNLVPVLKSYWLTLHVSVITGSYGFLGLGAILSIITLILLMLSNNSNRFRISDTIDELTVINYKTLTLGLYLLTIGTFLGAVWANESWGRYWGWDPKETWSLITIIIYSIVIHSRYIPGMKDVLTYNLLSLFAFSSVLMTYFGVNYYLSGLHSYAAGDPVPVPAFVYISVLVLAALSFGAYVKYRKWEKVGS